MVDFPVNGFDMTPHLANKHSTTLNHVNGITEQQHPPVILNGVNWSPWKRPRKQSTIGDNIYDLYAVCYHHGSDIETGHYTAACRNPYDNQWYLYDDAKVTNLSQETNDINPVLVNNSAYILFYQKRSGVYVSSSSSSAASTSSVGSSGDHWVARMPKFTIPKQYRSIEKNIDKNVDDENKTTSDVINNTDNEMNATNENQDKNELSPNVIEDAVTLRNSQNTLHSSDSSIRKSTEHKSTNTMDLKETINTATTTTTTNTNYNNHNTCDYNNHKPIYKTSIYINSTGNVDITTTTTKNSPVISTHRINGLSHEDVQIKLDNDNQGNCCFIDDPETCYLSSTDNNRVITSSSTSSSSPSTNGTLKWVINHNICKLLDL